MNEEEVYLGTKALLINNGYRVIAGQPPRGVDHLPVVEIKLGDNAFRRGSRYSYKPDLIAFRDNRFFIIECKPEFDSGDYNKVIDVLESEERKYALYRELEQRRLLDKVDYYEDFEVFSQELIGCLSYSGDRVERAGVMHIIVFDMFGDGEI